MVIFIPAILLNRKKVFNNPAELQCKCCGLYFESELIMEAHEHRHYKPQINIIKENKYND